MQCLQLNFADFYLNTWVQFSLVTQSCPTRCYPMDCSTPDLPVHCQLQEFTQTYVHWVGDAIQPSHPLSSPSPPTFNFPSIKVFSNGSAHCISNAIQPSHPLMLSSSALNVLYHHGLFQWVICKHQMPKILELQLQHQPFQWIFRIDLL